MAEAPSPSPGGKGQHTGDGAGIPVLSVAGSIFNSLAHIVLFRDARAAGEDRMAASLRDGRGAGQGVVVQGCGVQLGRFQGKVPTAMGGALLPESGAVGQMAPGRVSVLVGVAHRESVEEPREKDTIMRSL